MISGIFNVVMIFGVILSIMNRKKIGIEAEASVSSLNTVPNRKPITI